jgi:hypothetical protein
MERLLPMRACPNFFVLHLYKQSSSDIRVAFEMEHAATFSFATIKQSAMRALPYTTLCFIWAARLWLRLKLLAFGMP